jgi:hypothetical protein
LKLEVWFPPWSNPWEQQFFSFKEGKTDEIEHDPKKKSETRG